MRSAFLNLLILQCIATTTLAQVERHLICQGCKPTKPSPFWLPLKQTLESRIDFTSVTCVASEEDEQQAIEYVRQRKLQQPQVDIHVVATLLQAHHCETGATCRDLNPGDKYIPLLRAGVRGWFIENEPHFDDLGINRTSENLESIELFPDNLNGGMQVGQEFCRIAASIAPANIAVLYGDPLAAHSTARIEGFMAGLEEYCPEARHQIKYSFYAGWRSDKAAALMSPVFLRDGSIQAVIAANDDMALGALVSAREMRPGKQLLVAGYDANDLTRPLLKSGAMFATVDQNPPTGLIYTLEVMLSDKATGAANFGPPSDCSLSPAGTCGLEDYNLIQSAAWDELSEALPDKVSTAVSIRARDPSALVLRERLLLYNPAISPPVTSTTASDEPEPLPVLAQLKNFQIIDLDAASESVFGYGLLVLSWKDERLAWSTTDHPNVNLIHLDVNDIWHPVVVLSNLLKSGSAVPIQTIQTTIYSDGTVVWEQNINSGEFRCGSIDDTVLQFPFDSHHCGIDLSSYNVKEITFVPTLEIPAEEAFDVIVANPDWFQGSESVELETDDEAAKFETLQFRVGMTRDPTFVVLSMVVPSFLLNTISLAQFWIPTQSETINLDRGGMAITTILAALALRQSMASEVDTAFTLLDAFMLISLCFHFVGFLITAYESSYKQVKRLTDSRMGFLNRASKLTLPVIFGLSNLILSILWAREVWTLFYMSLVELVCVILLNRKDHQRVREAMSDRFSSGSVRERLGLSFNKPSTDPGASPEEAEEATQENIVRYMRWKALVTRETKDREENDPDGKAGDKGLVRTSSLTPTDVNEDSFASHSTRLRQAYAKQRHTDEAVAGPQAPTEGDAAMKLQRAFRQSMRRRKSQSISDSWTPSGEFTTPSDTFTA